MNQFLPKDEWWNETKGLTFSNKYLDLAACYVRKYIATKEFNKWHYLHFPKEYENDFYDILKEKSTNKYIIVQFWYHNEHLNMIVHDLEDTFFEEIWYEFYKDKYFSEINCKYIKCLSKFIKIIGFMYTLPENSNLILLCLWKDGIRNFLYKQLSKLNICEEFMNSRKVNGYWEIAALNIPNILETKDFIIPVSKEFKPTNKCTPYFVYLNQYKKLYFEKDKDFPSLDDITWEKLQFELGNRYSNVLENQVLYFYCKNDTFNILQKYFKRSSKMEKRYRDIIRNMKYLKDQKHDAQQKTAYLEKQLYEAQLEIAHYKKQFYEVQQKIVLLEMQDTKN